MRTDPTVNVVVFEVRGFLKKQTLIESCPTQAEDGIRQAWRTVQSQHNARPERIRHIYSEWEPSEADKEFIVATFPRAQVSFSFARPASEAEWNAALGDAAETMQAAMVKEILKERDALPQTDANLFPILRDYNDYDFFAETIVHRSIGAELAVFLAHVNKTSRGTLGIEYLMLKNIDASQEALEAQFAVAWSNLGSNLNVQAQKSETEFLFTLSHPSDLAASAIALPDFYQQVTSWVEREEIFVAFTDPSALYVTLPETRIATDLQKAVQESEYSGSVALTPACFILNKQGIRRVASRQGSEPRLE